MSIEQKEAHDGLSLSEFTPNKGSGDKNIIDTDLDGEPFTEDIDGEPLMVSDDDIDGVPL